MLESEHLPNPAAAADDQDTAQEIRKQPIPPPSSPRQYRAIGLIKGKYQPSEDQITKGSILRGDGTEIDTVLLGRVMSLVKNHLDLTQEHLWVVYPRTHQKSERFHAQIVGVWEPETLKPDQLSAEETSQIMEDGYFSVRGQIVFYNTETEKIILKVKRLPKKKGDPVKFFKLKLQGPLGEKPLNHFYDLQVTLAGDQLMVTAAEDIGYIKPRNKGNKRRPPRQFSSKPMLRSPKDQDPDGDRPQPRAEEVRPNPIQRPHKPNP